MKPRTIPRRQFLASAVTGSLVFPGIDEPGRLLLSLARHARF